MKENKKYLKIFLYTLLAIVLLILPEIISNSYYQLLINQTLINAIVVMGLNYICLLYTSRCV